MLVDIEDIVKRQLAYSLETASSAAVEAASTSAKRGKKTATTNSTLDIPPPISNTYINGFRQHLITWFVANRRKMPWRGDNTAIAVSPYGVWISEIMLQQTRVETVVDYWLRWMEKFPTVTALAKSSNDEVNQLWAGLGYYRRARNLLLGAQYVEQHYNGVLPSDKEELLKIPGIGPYTAGAISSIAYQQANGLVDGNVHRVFSRLFALQHPIGGGKMEKICWSLADTLVDPDQPGAYNQGLMELGATICKPTNPSCAACPVSDFCAAKALTSYLSEQSTSYIHHNIISPHFPELARDEKKSYKVIDSIPQSITFFPQKVSKKKSKDVFLLIHAIRTKSHQRLPQASTSSSEYKYLFLRRPDKGLLASQWELPNIVIACPTVADNECDDDEDGEDDQKDDANATALKEVDMLSLYSTNQQSIKSYFVDRCGALWLDSAGSNPQDESKVTMIFESKQEIQPLHEPIVHIFSHEKHTMFVIVEEVHALSIDDKAERLFEEKFREDLCWRTIQEMHEAGITTGCKKVLKAIEQGLDTSKVKTEKRKIKEENSKKSTASLKFSKVNESIKVKTDTSNTETIDLSMEVAEDNNAPTSTTTSSKAIAKGKRPSSNPSEEVKNNTISKYFQKKG